MTFTPATRKAPIFNIEDARVVLLEAKSLLDSMNLPCFLLFGTCLGAVREKGLIPWDYDIDIGIMGLEKLGEIKNVFIEHGYTQTSHGKDHFQYFPGKKNGVLLDIHPYIDTGEYLVTFTRFNQGWLKIPSRFKPTETIEMCGAEFLVPSPVEEYLEWTYGDWKTPSDKSATDI